MVSRNHAAEERQRRFIEVSAELVEIARHKVVDLVGEREGELLEELDRLEHEEGLGQFDGCGQNE